MKTSTERYKVTKNACKLCTPLGACLAFRGIEKCVPVVHGSQGCATYIRRYMISHYREPVDIASSNFSENTAIYGGSDNLERALRNIDQQYNPDMIGIATTCLSETIGDDVSQVVNDFKIKTDSSAEFVHVSTPSYTGTHASGYKDACFEIVKHFAKHAIRNETVTVVPGMFSPADIRQLKDILSDFHISHLVVPDYSETLDGPLWEEYRKIPGGGTPVERMKLIGGSRDCIEFNYTRKEKSAAEYLFQEQGVEPHTLDYPIGVEATDEFMKTLSVISGKEIPGRYLQSRGRLLDAMVDGHKHAAGVRTMIYGEEDLVVGLARFAAEMGLKVVLCASGEKGGNLTERIGKIDDSIEVMEGADFSEISEAAEERKIELLIGNSKGYKCSRAMDIPLVRVGFPVHDRIGGQRILHVAYEGGLALYDKIINEIIAWKQNKSSFGYTYQ